VPGSFIENFLVKTGCKNSSEVTTEKSFHTHWNIDTKYYTAGLDILVAPDKAFPIRDGSNILDGKSIEAVVLYFDPLEPTSFENVKSLMKSLEENDPAVRLIACDMIQDEKIKTFDKIMSWCVKNQFELVELNPEDKESDIYGLERCIDALQANTWSNMVVKNPSTLSALMGAAVSAQQMPTKQLGDGDRQRSAQVEAEEEWTEFQSRTPSVPSESVDAASIGQHEAGSCHITMPDDIAICDAGNDHELEESSMEQLFANMAFMKEKAQTLPHEDRKAYAEKVALAFLDALGAESDDESEEEP